MRLVKVFSSCSLNEVNYIKVVLESNEIECAIFDEATAAIAPHYLFHQQGARVMVREEDVKTAMEYINDYESTKKEINEKES